MNKSRIVIKTYAILVIMMMISTLNGCYDKREIDELAYPLAIGLDIGKADVLRLTLQMAQPLAIGGSSSEGGSGGGSKETSSIVTVDTPSLYSGLNLINNLISKEINTSHAKTVIISRKLAESHMKKYLHALIRGREFRPDVFVVISNCPAEEYLKNVQPMLESNPAKYYELMLGKRFTSFYPGTRLNDFYYAVESDSIQPVAILADLSKYKSSEDFKSAGTPDSRTKVHGGRYEAGNIPIAAKQKNEVMGMAVFKNEKMIGTANGSETVCYHLLRGDYKYSYWTVPDPSDNDNIVVLDISQRKKPAVKAQIAGERTTITIKLDLEGDFTSIQSGRPYEDYPVPVEKIVKEMIQREILTFLKRTTDEFDSDICGFGKYVKGKFMTWDSWEQFNWFDKYKHTAFNVSVDFKIRRTGLMIRSVGLG